MMLITMLLPTAKGRKTAKESVTTALERIILFKNVLFIIVSFLNVLIS